MRGEVVRDARPGRARNALVALQVTGSVLLLICSAVFLRSSWAAAAVDPGIRTAGIVSVSILNEQRRGAILEAVKSEPSVASVAAALPGVLGGRPALCGRRERQVDGHVPVCLARVLRRPRHRSRARARLHRDRAERETRRWRSCPRASRDSCGRASTPSGKSCASSQTRQEGAGDQRRAGRMTPPLVSRSLVVVGVARDVAGFRLGGFRLAGAGVYVPISAEAARTSLTMRVRGECRARASCARRSAGGDRSQHGRGRRRCGPSAAPRRICWAFRSG